MLSWALTNGHVRENTEKKASQTLAKPSRIIHICLTINLLQKQGSRLTRTIFRLILLCVGLVRPAPMFDAGFFCGPRLFPNWSSISETCPRHQAPR